MTNKLPTSMEFILGTNVTATSTGVANYPREPEETFEQWLKRNVREFPVTLDLTSDVLAWVSRIVTYCIENPAGEWISPKEHPISKRKYPQAFYPTEVWFISTFSDIKTAIRELQTLDREIDTALAASLRDGAC